MLDHPNGDILARPKTFHGPALGRCAAINLMELRAFLGSFAVVTLPEKRMIG